jgi:nicotinamide-nucleotide amidase
MEAELEEQSRRVLERCRREGLRVAVVEACAGGMISASLTAIPGSSSVVDVGLVPYSNESKRELLGVPQALLEAHGAVSAEVAGAMAQGVLARSRAEVALAETGIAGPGGATPSKPVGLVFIAVARRGGELTVERHVFPGDRRAVRLAAASRGLALILERLGP